MSVRRWFLSATLLVAAHLTWPVAAHAQLTMVENGFLGTTLSNDFAKQVELGVGPDTCLYYGSNEGLRRRCGPFDPGTICDENLPFPVGIAFSTGGSFGSAMYVADYAIGDVHVGAGCAATTPFATLPGPGALAFPPSGSAYGDYLYTCAAFDGPIYRVSSTGVLTSWLELEATYLRFGPGGVWGTGLYATEHSTPGDGQIVKVSSTGVVTPLVGDFLVPEGFDWGFDGDLFATDPSYGQILRVKPNGTATLFATLPGAADVAYRAGEQALYVVSNQGGFYRITPGTSTDVPDASPEFAALTVSPSPMRDACAIHFTLREGGTTRGKIFDAAGRLVRRLPEVWRPAGSHSLTWDGRDDAGAPARPGAYFVQMFVAGETRNARVTIVR